MHTLTLQIHIAYSNSLVFVNDSCAHLSTNARYVLLIISEHWPLIISLNDFVIGIYFGRSLIENDITCDLFVIQLRVLYLLMFGVLELDSLCG